MAYDGGIGPSREPRTAATTNQGRTVMLVSKVTCPKCKTVLKPTSPLESGKKVKCPKCKNDFTAAPDEEDKESAKNDKAAAPAKTKAKKPAAKKAEPAAEAKA